MRILKATGLSRNAAFAMAQSVFALVTVLISYRVLVAYHGPKQLGLWALITGIVSVSRIVDVSGGSALPRFVSLAQRDKDSRLAADYIDTTTISLFLLYGVLIAVAWFPLRWAIVSTVEPEFITLGLSVLPLVLFSMLAMVISTSMAGALDGLSRADLRAAAMISGFFVQVGSGLLLIPEYGVIGFGIAQILQFVWLYGLCRLLLKRYIPNLAWLPLRWTNSCFRQSLSYGLQVQAANLASSFIEPAIRFFMNLYGGLAFVAVYDIANKIIVQIRVLISSAISPTVPIFAAAESSHFEERRAIVDNTNRMAASVGSVLIIGVGAIAPLAGRFLLGTHETDFVYVCAILVTGHFLTIITLVQYFQAQAVGKMRWNIFGLGVTAALTMILSVPLGSYYGGVGVTVAAVIASVIGSFFSFYNNVKRISGLPIAAAFPSSKYLLALAGSYVAGILLLFVSAQFADRLLAAI